MERRRQGSLTVELLMASVILVAAFLPTFTTMQSNHHGAHVLDYHVLARRIAGRALAAVETQSYGAIRAALKKASPPEGVDAGLGASSCRVDLGPLTGADAELLGLGKDAEDRETLEGICRRAATMPVEVYFEELEPGFGRLTALVTWTDMASGHRRHLVTLRFVEDPFHKGQA